VWLFRLLEIKHKSGINHHYPSLTHHYPSLTIILLKVANCESDEKFWKVGRFVLDCSQDFILYSTKIFPQISPEHPSVRLSKLWGFNSSTSLINPWEWILMNQPAGQWINWVWVNTYRYIFSGMNIHLPAILGFTRYQGFDTSPIHGYPKRWCCDANAPRKVER